MTNGASGGHNSGATTLTIADGRPYQGTPTLRGRRVDMATACPPARYQVLARRADRQGYSPGRPNRAPRHTPPLAPPPPAPPAAAQAALRGQPDPETSGHQSAHEPRPAIAAT